MAASEGVSGAGDRRRGLVGRRVLFDRIAHAIALTERTAQLTGLVLIDLNGFREINDSYGRSAGDALLRDVGRRLATNVRAIDTVARTAADEFAVLVEEAGSETFVAEIVERLLAAIGDEPFLVSDRRLPTTASAGFATAVAGTDPVSLWADAAAALSKAKEGGAGGWQPFRPEIRAAVRARLELAAELRRAIDGTRSSPTTSRSSTWPVAGPKALKR